VTYIIIQNFIFILERLSLLNVKRTKQYISCIREEILQFVYKQVMGVKGRHMIGKWWLSQWKLGKMHAYPQFSLGRKILPCSGPTTTTLSKAIAHKGRTMGK